jgi:hypothetical protein
MSIPAVICIGITCVCLGAVIEAILSNGKHSRETEELRLTMYRKGQATILKTLFRLKAVKYETTEEGLQYLAMDSKHFCNVDEELIKVINSK